MIRLSTVLFLFILVCTYTQTVQAYSGGINGRTQSGCGTSGCHGASNTATTVFLREGSGPFTMQPGQSKTFKAVVAHATQPKAGINVSVKNGSGQNAGTFSALNSLTQSGGELIHSNVIALAGGEAEFGFTWTAPSTPGTYTIRAAGNAVNDNGGTSGDSWNLLSGITITVESTNSIQLTTQNTPAVYCRDASVSFAWTGNGLSGTTALEYSATGTTPWVPIANIPASQLTYTWTIPSAFAFGTTYKFRVVNGTVSDTSDANTSVAPSPVITVQPNQIDSVCIGGNKSLSITMERDEALFTYQWYRNDAIVPGATSRTLTLTNVQLFQAGTYKVVATGCTSVTSQNVQLIVLPATSIVTQPQGKTACIGENVTLSVTTLGINVQYEWRKNGTTIANSNSASYTINSITTNDAASYSCIVTGQCGAAVTSSNAAITVIPNPVTTLAFTNDSTICSGLPLILRSSTTGGSIVEYIWKKNGTRITNSDTVLAFSSISPADSGTYSVSAKNSCGVISQEKSVTIYVSTQPSILRITADTSVTVNTELRLRILAAGKNARYQWKKNGTVLPSDTNAVFVRNQAQYADSGSYTCEVKNQCGTVISSISKVSITNPPSGPVLSLKTTNVDFGCIDKGTVKDSTIASLITNTGDQQLLVSDIIINGKDATNFSLKGNKSFTLQPSESTSLVLSFAPNGTSNANAELSIISNAAKSPSIVTLTGVSCYEELDTRSISFGNYDISSGKKDSTIRLYNRGTKSMIVNAITFTSGENYTLVNLLPLPATISSNGFIELNIEFSAKTSGVYRDTLVVNSALSINSIPFQANASGNTSVSESYYNARLKLFPIPANEYIQFSGIDIENIQSLSMIDPLGKRYIVPIQQSRISTDGFATGIWLMEFILNNGTIINEPLMIIR